MLVFFERHHGIADLSVPGGHHGLAGMGTYHDRGKSQAIAMALGFWMFLEDGDGYCKFNGLYMASPYEEPPIHKLATSIYIIY